MSSRAATPTAQPAPSTLNAVKLDPARLTALDDAFLADRQAARLAGPGAWAARLRSEAITFAVRHYEMTRPEAEAELDAELGSASLRGETTEQALEGIVASQRMLVAIGAMGAALPIILGAEATNDGR